MPISTNMFPASTARSETREGCPKILIVDNDENVLIALERSLEDEGYVTATALGQNEAWKFLSEVRFDGLVLDDYLSEKDSIEFLTDLRSVERTPASVVVTYHRQPSQSMQVRLRLLGVNALVRKCELSELRRIMHELLDGTVCGPYCRVEGQD